jgi:hypothetical protein
MNTNNEVRRIDMHETYRYKRECAYELWELYDIIACEDLEDQLKFLLSSHAKEFNTFTEKRE